MDHVCNVFCNQYLGTFKVSLHLYNREIFKDSHNQISNMVYTRRLLLRKQVLGRTEGV